MQTCPRCKTDFTCTADDVSNCSCQSVTLAKETRDFLSLTFYKCLCTDCLRALNELVPAARSGPFPFDKEELVPGLHYYLEENGYRVFTEFYHIQRGHCCRNACRHCAYGYKKKYWDG